MYAHDVGREEINRLSEHAGLGLDAAHAPADDAETIDHRRVRIRADERIWITNTVRIREHAFGEELEVYLVDDADAWRHDLERVEGLHAPFQKLIALAIARELEFTRNRERYQF